MKPYDNFQQTTNIMHHQSLKWPIFHKAAIMTPNRISQSTAKQNIADKMTNAGQDKNQFSTNNKHHSGTAHESITTV